VNVAKLLRLAFLPACCSVSPNLAPAVTQGSQSCSVGKTELPSTGLRVGEVTSSTSLTTAKRTVFGRIMSDQNVCH